MNCSRFFGLLVLFVFAFTFYSQGQGNAAIGDFQCFGTDTFAGGLNDAGQVVGWYGPFEIGQSFLKKKNGPCEHLPGVEGATATIAVGINDPGQIVGITLPGRITYSEGNGSGFLFEKGVYTLLDYPDAGPDRSQQTCQTFAFSINNRGQVVGLYDRWRLDSKDGWVCNGPDRPFMREADGTFVTLPVLSSWTDSVQVNAINPRGMTIGNYINVDTCNPGPCKERGYLRSDGVVWSFAAPGAWDTMPTGINPQGEIVGRYFIEPWLAPVGPCHSFFLDMKDGVPVEIQYPNATFTCIGSINAPGEVSGAWTNDWANGPWRSFVVDIKALLPPQP